MAAKKKAVAKKAPAKKKAPARKASGRTPNPGAPDWANKLNERMQGRREAEKIATERNKERKRKSRSAEELNRLRSGNPDRWAQWYGSAFAKKARRQKAQEEYEKFWNPRDLHKIKNRERQRNIDF